MKNVYKRALSMLLAIILIVSAFPFTAFAGGEGESLDAPTEVYYDFAVRGTYASQMTLGDMSVENADNRDLFEGLYADGTLNWVYEGKYLGTVKKDGTGDIAADFAKNMYTTTGIQANKSVGYNWWYAIRIKAPGTGKYDVTVNTYLAAATPSDKHSIWTEAYLFDAAAVDAEETTIAASLIEENKLANGFCPTSAQPDANLGSYNFSAGKEYILVLRQTGATYDAANGDGLRTSNLYLKGITMTPKMSTTGVTVNYGFDLPNRFPDDITATTIPDQKAAIEQLYENGDINWSYVGYKPATQNANGSGDTLDFRYNRFYTSDVYSGGSGIYIKTNYGYNWWYALKLKSPGEGTFNVTINNVVCPEATAKAGLWMEAYMLNASVIENAADDAAVKAAIDAAIDAADTSAIKLQDMQPTVNAPDSNLGAFTFAADTEYILVLRQNSRTYNAAKAALGNNNFTVHFHASGITMTELEEIPDESTEGETTGTTTAPEDTTVGETTVPDVTNEPLAGYDFDLLSYYTGLTSSLDNAANLQYMEALYNAGKIDWRFEAKKNGVEKMDGSGNEVNSFTKNDFVKTRGFQVNATYGFYWYYALRVKAPGTGTYDLTINSLPVAVSTDVSKHSIWTETYFFDASLLTGETKIDDLLTDGNKLKRFAPTVDAPDAYVGNVATQAGKEYILVLRMSKDTYNAANADGLRTSNLYLKSLTFTEAEPPEVPKTGYDFDLLTNYPDDFATGNFSVSDQKAKIDKFYENGYISWRFEGLQNGTIKADGTGGEGETFTRNMLVKGSGLQMNIGVGYNWWYAIRVKSPGTGTYDLTVNTFTGFKGDEERHSIWTETYFFDAAKLTGGKTINDMLIRENKIKRFAPTVDNKDALVGNVATEAGKDYILVFRMTEDTYKSANADGLRSGCVFLKGLTFVAAEPPEPDKVGYNFDILTTFPDDFVGGKTSVTDQQSLIKEFFKKGYSDWTFEGFGVYDGGNGAYSQNAFMKGSGIQLYTTGYDWYYTIRFRSPGKGAHKVEVETYLPYNTETEQYKHSVWTDAYIMDASLLDNGKTTIDDFMLKKNLLGVFEPTVDKSTAELGYYTFEEGKEYILILRQTKKSYNASKEDGLGTLNLYLKSLKFTYTANPPQKVVDTSKVVYDFDLRDPKTGIYTGNPMINEQYDDISRLYSLEELNWQLQEPVKDAGWKFAGLGGVTLYSKADDYIAFRIKSPGKGKYTLTLDHGTHGRGAKGGVYILPADTQDITAALDTSNRVGLMNFYNQTGDVVVEDGVISLLGTWEFGNADEYIVVVEAFGTSPYTSEAYMYISKLICEKGDTTSKYKTEKTPNSICVAPAAVKINHASIMNATAEINGYDYFFMPQEGKSFSVYNLDTKEFVSQLNTPFTSCRGITVDPDGYVWMVGDNSYIFRYDPYLDVGESVYYYKGFSADLNDTSKVPDSSSAFGLTYGDGYLFFGVFKDGWLVKYNIATGEFTRMGQYGSADAQDYVSTPVYKDGYVYANTVGDSDGDGKKTFEVFKVDVATNKLVERLDITQYVSQKEVMLRGMSICGDVLLIGGDQNDVKNVLAVDTSTWEVLDLGISGFISYYPSKEIDGKCYFLAQGRGMWEFDAATKTATQVKGLEEATVGFRSYQYCTMTFENNDKFPGISYVAFRGSINTPTIYNMETGTLMTIDDMILDEYGNGQEVRSIYKGFGENEIYIGAYRTNDCSVFNTVEGKLVHAYATNSAQTDVMYIYKGNLYAGNYNAAVLTQVNLADERRNVSLLSLKSMYEQARIHAITGGDNYIFCGSIPDVYKYGGCLAWVNLDTLENTVIRNAVQDQSIVALAYNDGLIYAGSCVTGGTSSADRMDLSAKIVIYDVATKTKCIEIDPHDYISGLPERLTGIDALVADPNVATNGKIWVHMGARLLCLKYNKDTNKVTLTEELCFDEANAGGSWHPFTPVLDGNYMYVGFGQKGGLRKVNLNNPSDNVRMPVPGNKMFTIADDGNIYYASVNSLYMYPLNVTNDDWAVAGKVDDMIAALGKASLENADQILAARAAYEALSNKHKALIQNIYDLETAEIDLLECKIDSIGEVTLEDGDLINAIRKEYKALTPKNRTYVKNYMSVFVPALEAYQTLVDQKEAARVQALIDGIKDLGEITLEDEAAIQKIREQYDLLTKSQRALVDATLLLEAEATIKALRQVRIDRLIQLIGMIGDPVTLADEPIIVEAMEIYDWMHYDERTLVDYEKLTLAEGQLKKLQKAAAAEVDALILAIGDEVTADSGDAIRAAREAYDALTPGSKAYVKNLAYLESAEALFAEFGSPVTLIVIIAAAVVVVAGAVVTFLLLRKKKAKKATNA